MQISEIIHSAQDALKGNRLRTALTMLGIVIGISSVIMISSVGQGAVAYITNELSAFGTNYFQVTPGKGVFASFAGTSRPLTEDDSNAIAEDSGISNIESVAPFAYAQRRVSANDEDDTVLIYGMTSTSQVLLKPEMVYGEFFDETQDLSGGHIAIIGHDVSEKLFGPDTNPVGESIRIDEDKYRVIGVTKSPGGFVGSFFNTAINVPLKTMTQDISGKNELAEIDISVYDENQLDQTIEDVNAFLRDRRNIKAGEDPDYTITSFKDSLTTVQTITSLLTALISGISAISLIVGGVGVMNIMLVTVTERTKEIGLLKAIGAKQRDILVQFLIESVTLSVAGGIVGILVGISGAYVIAKIANIPFVVNLLSVALAVGVSSLVGIVFGLYPASRAARLNPIDALRHE